MVVVEGGGGGGWSEGVVGEGVLGVTDWITYGNLFAGGQF